ncbi:MAG: Fic family protein [Flavitalea sp.]
MATYIWQKKWWPNFVYSTEDVEDSLLSFARTTGEVTGILKSLPETSQTEAVIDMMVSEAIKTSEIEGEYLSRRDVMSSIRNNLGLNSEPDPVADKKANGIAELMIDVRSTYSEPLTEAKLFEWHRMLMSGSKRINAGAWRTHHEPMQVISGSVSNPTVHYEAPPSEQVPAAMEQYIRWFNESAPGGNAEIKQPPIRAAIAHLYFETIHPFEDGNGRIGRAIAEKALSQGLGRPVLLSLSRTIEAEKKAYYNALEYAQKSDEISEWIGYFVKTTLSAQYQAEKQIDFTLRKVKFFDRYRDQLNERQMVVVKRMMEEGPAGFQGGMSAKKYMVIAKTSKATATRDLQELLARGAFIPDGEGGGRSTKYQLSLVTDSASTNVY